MTFLFHVLFLVNAQKNMRNNVSEAIIFLIFQVYLFHIYKVKEWSHTYFLRSTYDYSNPLKLWICRELETKIVLFCFTKLKLTSWYPHLNFRSLQFFINGLCIWNIFLIWQTWFFLFIPAYNLELRVSA